jgi:hypothetical protein
MLFLLGAIGIFGLSLVTANRYMVDQSEDVIRREYEYFAASLAQGYIEEAKGKAFDENTIEASPLDSTGFTLPTALLFELLETYPNFDDIDDYNTYADTVSTSRGDFIVNIDVVYVEEATPEVAALTQTYYKKMTVRVSNEFLASPVELSYIFGYLKN